MEIENVRLLNNTQIEGGVIRLYHSYPAITNCLIAENQGYGIYCELSNPYLTNVTISKNDTVSGYYQGGAIYCRTRSHPVIVNSILWNDLTMEIILDDWYSDSSAVTVQHTDLQGGEEGISNNNEGTVYWLEGNIDMEPFFTTVGDDPYALSSLSPCIDVGIDDTTGFGLPIYDILWNQRIWDGDGNDTAVIDMGAYEYGSLPVGIPDSEFQVPGSRFRVEVWPNPAEDEVVVSVVSRQSSVVSQVTLKIYDLYGREVRTLADEAKIPGEYTVRMDVSELPPGVYLVRLQAGGQSAVRKLVVR
jgi:hypothetical protein